MSVINNNNGFGSPIPQPVPYNQRGSNVSSTNQPQCESTFLSVFFFSSFFLLNFVISFEEELVAAAIWDH